MIDAFTGHISEILWIIAIAALAIVAVLTLRYYTRRRGAEHGDEDVLRANRHECNL